MFAHAYGRAYITDLTDTFRAHPLFYYSPGQIVRCCVLRRSGTQVDISLRPSRVGTADDEEHLPEINEVADVKQDALVQGYVTSLSEKGLFVVRSACFFLFYVALNPFHTQALSRHVSARVLLSDLSDDRKQCLLKFAQERFKIGALVTARVTEVDVAAKRVQLSLRKSVLYKQQLFSFGDLKVCDKMEY